MAAWWKTNVIEWGCAAISRWFYDTKSWESSTNILNRLCFWHMEFIEKQWPHVLLLWKCVWVFFSSFFFKCDSHLVKMRNVQAYFDVLHWLMVCICYYRSQGLVISPANSIFFAEIAYNKIYSLYSHNDRDHIVSVQSAIIFFI